MARHEIKPERRTLHGTFSREYEPVLTIDSGDTVLFETLDPGWDLSPPWDAAPGQRQFEPRDSERDGGHALCGPLAIRGAEPGKVLEIQIGRITPGTWGWSFAGGWANRINERLGLDREPRCDVQWTLDPETMTGTTQHGHRVELRPFMGVMGMPPAQPGIHSTGPPRACGGNLDCKELTAGSTLYLPIEVEGALFSVGDGHARQGDGEVCQIAIEAPMAAVELTFAVRDDLSIGTPQARVANGWLTMGLDEDLHEATALALEAMLDVMVARYGMDRKYALALASVVVDFRITQIANRTLGVHALLDDRALEA